MSYHFNVTALSIFFFFQWKDEIEGKCQPDLLRVHIHHGKDKAQSVKELRSYDVRMFRLYMLTADFVS
jgi:hypothetical protein